jgi:hypothetical protein
MRYECTGGYCGLRVFNLLKSSSNQRNGIVTATLKVYKKSREGIRPQPSSGLVVLYARGDSVGYIAEGVWESQSGLIST